MQIHVRQPNHVHTTGHIQRPDQSLRPRVLQQWRHAAASRCIRRAVAANSARVARLQLNIDAFRQIYDNAITALPVDVFAGLTRLIDVSVNCMHLCRITRTAGRSARMDSLCSRPACFRPLLPPSRSCLARPCDCYHPSRRCSDMQHNYITQLPSDSFAGMTRLLYLLVKYKYGVFVEHCRYMNDNLITAIDPGLFADLTSLRQLCVQVSTLHSDTRQADIVQPHHRAAGRYLRPSDPYPVPVRVT